jgi:hypothetical protein
VPLDDLAARIALHSMADDFGRIHEDAARGSGLRSGEGRSRVAAGGDVPPLPIRGDEKRRSPMTCAKCGWPIKLVRTRKVLRSVLATFKCMNPKCRHEHTEIAQPN